MNVGRTLKLLRRLGFEYRKPKGLPHVADEVKQAGFIAFYEALMNNLPASEAVNFPPIGDKPPAFSRFASANLLMIFSPEF